MNTKLSIGVWLLIIISSCRTPDYLPKVESIDTNARGSYIKLVRQSLNVLSGELIAVDSTGVTVLSERSKKCVCVPYSEVHKYSLLYAQPPRYGWTIPVFTLATMLHGVILIFTAPLSLITTISVTSSAQNAYKYTNQDIKYEELKMFARFPQGIPSGIFLSDIK